MKITNKKIDRRVLARTWKMDLGLSDEQLKTVAGGRLPVGTDKPPNATSGSASSVCCWSCY